MSQDGPVTGQSLTQAAVEELYSHPMAEFTTRRKALAADAKKAGDREASQQIAALRKPTLSADTLNKLVRAAPDEVDELLRLGAELRAAEKALNASELRELSTQRRQLVSDLTRLAFDITDQPTPSASIRDEVTATLNAALADEDVADRLMSGALVAHARWDGFGSTSLPELATVLSLRPGRRAAPAKTGNTTGGTQPLAVEKASRLNAPAKVAAPAARTAAQRAAAAASEAAERERRRRLEAARLEAAEAQDVATRAQEQLATIDRRISELSLQLAHQRELLAGAQRHLRDAQARRRAATLALTRAGGSLEPSP